MAREGELLSFILLGHVSSNVAIVGWRRSPRLAAELHCVLEGADCSVVMI